LDIQTAFASRALRGYDGCDRSFSENFAGSDHIDRRQYPAMDQTSETETEDYALLRLPQQPQAMAREVGCGWLLDLDHQGGVIPRTVAQAVVGSRMGRLVAETIATVMAEVPVAAAAIQTLDVVPPPVPELKERALAVHLTPAAGLATAQTKKFRL
jgi:hypothetical protein